MVTQREASPSETMDDVLNKVEKHPRLTGSVLAELEGWFALVLTLIVLFDSITTGPPARPSAAGMTLLSSASFSGLPMVSPWEERASRGVAAASLLGHH